MTELHRSLTRRTLVKAGVAAAGLAMTTRNAVAAAASTMSLPLVQAAPSDSLVEIMGVRTDLQEANTSLYGDLGLVLASMRADSTGLGLRHTREAIVLPSINATKALNQRTAWAELANLGADVTCGLGDPDDRNGTVPEFADYIKNALGGNSGYVTAVENSNEPNSPLAPWNLTERNSWVELVRTRQEQMASAFRSDPALDQIQLAGPPLVGGTGLIKYQTLGDLSPNVDLGNFHFYSGNREQSVPSFELDQIMSGVAVNAPGSAVICTETGMHQASQTTTGMAYHPESVAGIYMPRVPLEHFLRGVSRVCEFQLLDDHANPSLTDSASHFGLLRYNSASLDPKPAYSSLKRLLDLLRDPGVVFTPASLAMQITNAPMDYRQLLFEKSNGHRYLCIWRDVSIWDQVNAIAIKVAAVNVRLNLEVPATVNVFRPARRTAPMTTHVNTLSVTVALAGEVHVLEIV